MRPGSDGDTSRQLPINLIIWLQDHEPSFAVSVNAQLVALGLTLRNYFVGDVERPLTEQEQKQCDKLLQAGRDTIFEILRAKKVSAE